MANLKKDIETFGQMAHQNASVVIHHVQTGEVLAALDTLAEQYGWSERIEVETHGKKIICYEIPVNSRIECHLANVDAGVELAIISSFTLDPLDFRRLGMVFFDVFHINRTNLTIIIDYLTGVFGSNLTVTLTPHTGKIAEVDQPNFIGSLFLSFYKVFILLICIGLVGLAIYGLFSLSIGVYSYFH